ncbi:MAG: hypothetical protein ACYC0D_10630, partial [Candidatus Humimicrobiaceae bacterium]
MIAAENKNYEITINDLGSIISLNDKIINHELLSSNHENNPIFFIRFRLENADICTFSAFDASEILTAKEMVNHDLKITLNFLRINKEDLNIKVTIILPENNQLINFFLEIENKTAMQIEWVDFPNISIPFKSDNIYDYEKILWPLGEGVLIDGKNKQYLSNKSDYIKNDILYDTNFAPGMYPGLATA